MVLACNILIGNPPANKRHFFRSHSFVEISEAYERCDSSLSMIYCNGDISNLS